jgi:hypothetical protein
MVVPIARWDTPTGASTPNTQRVRALGPTGSETGRFVFVHFTDGAFGDTGGGPRKGGNSLTPPIPGR